VGTPKITRGSATRYLPASQDAGNGIAFEDNSLHKIEFFLLHKLVYNIPAYLGHRFGGDMGPRFGGDMGPRFESPFWDPDLGP
jgi:hypothetical protein